MMPGYSDLQNFSVAESGEILNEPVVAVNGAQRCPLLLGVGAYPRLPWLTKPFPNNVNLNDVQRSFNRRLSSARVVVERAFGVLKGRWRILLKRLDNRFANVSEIILSCCILHNICQEAGDEYDEEEIIQRVIAIERHCTHHQA